jgi:hypothetical protein
LACPLAAGGNRRRAAGVGGAGVGEQAIKIGGCHWIKHEKAWHAPGFTGPIGLSRLYYLLLQELLW